MKAQRLRTSTPRLPHRTAAGAALLALVAFIPSTAWCQTYLAVGDSGSQNSVIYYGSTGSYAGFVGGLDQPSGLTYDSSGNLYVENTGDGIISKVTSGGAVSTFASLSQGSFGGGLAFSSGGNLYVSNSGTPNGIVEFNSSGGAAGFTAGFNNPAGLAFDSSGNLYVANLGTNQILKLSSGGALSVFDTLSQGTLAGGLTVNGSGDVYVSITGTANGIDEFNSSGGVAGFTSLGTNVPGALTSNSSGDVFIAITGSNLVSELTPGGALSSFTSLSQGSIEGLAVAVPEPAEVALVLGLAALVLAGWRSRRVRSATG